MIGRNLPHQFVNLGPRVPPQTRKLPDLDVILALDRQHAQIGPV
jgi:hypothetical protein